MGSGGGYVRNWLHDGADVHLEPPKRDEGNPGVMFQPRPKGPTTKGWGV